MVGGDGGRVRCGVLRNARVDGVEVEGVLESGACHAIDATVPWPGVQS